MPAELIYSPPSLTRATLLKGIFFMTTILATILVLRGELASSSLIEVTLSRRVYHAATACWPITLGVFSLCLLDSMTRITPTC